MSERSVSNGHETYRLVGGTNSFALWLTLYYECNGRQIEILFRDEKLLELTILALQQALREYRNEHI